MAYGMTCSQFFDPSLSIRLIELGIPESSAGLGFSAFGAAIVVSSPWTGWCCENFKIRYVMETGLLIMALCFALIGPIPLFEPQNGPQIWMMMVGLFIMGFGDCMCYVPTAVEIINSNTEIEKEKLYQKFKNEDGYEEPMLTQMVN
jgi:MFS family permease